jgi:hypothetical protein
MIERQLKKNWSIEPTEVEIRDELSRGKYVATIFFVSHPPLTKSFYSD